MLSRWKFLTSEEMHRYRRNQCRDSVGDKQEAESDGPRHNNIQELNFENEEMICRRVGMISSFGLPHLTPDEDDQPNLTYSDWVLIPSKKLRSTHLSALNPVIICTIQQAQHNVRGVDIRIHDTL
jgi:hypothetical protein